MRKFTKLKYSEVETKKVSDFETSFSISPLERGFGNTLGNAVRRILLSSITGVSSFAVKIEGVDHEFQTLSGVTEDVVQIILNLKKVRFVFNPEIFAEDQVVKVSLNSPKGEVFARDFELPAGVEIANVDEYIATTAKAGALELELFVTTGRGFKSFEENKDVVKQFASKIESKITNGALIAIDSDFSPVVNVSYDSTELNSSAAIIEEKLTFNVKTDGSVEAKDAVAQAAHILIAHLEVLSNVSNITKEEIFNENIVVAKPAAPTVVPLTQLMLSARSSNCLKRAGFETLEQLGKITKKELEQIKNLGKKSVEEILEKLQENGITLEEGE